MVDFVKMRDLSTGILRQKPLEKRQLRRQATTAIETRPPIRTGAFQCDGRLGMEQVNQLFATEVVLQCVDFFAKPGMTQSELELAFKNLQAASSGVINHRE